MINTMVVVTALAILAALPVQAIDQGDLAPPWRGIDLADGEEVAFPAVTGGKPAVLVFWATWCPYCKAFMPYAKGIQADYGDRGVQIVTFNAKERGQGDPKAYVDSLGFPMIAVADADTSLILSGTGDVLEPEDGLIGIGSGGPYALAAARALMRATEQDAVKIAEHAMAIAAEICIYTNDNVTIETF